MVNKNPTLIWYQESPTDSVKGPFPLPMVLMLYEKLAIPGTTKWSVDGGVTWRSKWRALLNVRSLAALAAGPIPILKKDVKGVVTCFSEEKGWGLIKREDNKETIWFHERDVTSRTLPKGSRFLEVGQKVQFDVARKGKYGIKAFCITYLDGNRITHVVPSVTTLNGTVVTASASKSPTGPEVPAATVASTCRSADSSSPLALLQHNDEVEDPCENVRLVASFMARKLAGCVDVEKLRKDVKVAEFFGKKKPKCRLCPSKKEKNVLDKPDAFILHFVSATHLDLILANDGEVSEDALFFWIDAMARASTNKHEASDGPISSLNRLLVQGVVDPTSPLALLEYSKEAPEACPDVAGATSLLAKMLKKCDIARFDEEVKQCIGVTLHCGMCAEYKRIRSGNDFIAHVTREKHVENAIANGGQVSQTALLFWLSSLLAAGASFSTPQEEERVAKLFGDYGRSVSDS